MFQEYAPNFYNLTFGDYINVKSQFILAGFCS